MQHIINKIYFESQMGHGPMLRSKQTAGMWNDNIVCYIRKLYWRVSTQQLIVDSISRLQIPSSVNFIVIDKLPICSEFRYFCDN